MGHGKYHPVKAIDEDGQILDIKMITDNGEFLLVNVVKGIKMNTYQVETTVNGINVYAHVKSIPQVKY